MNADSGCESFFISVIGGVVWSGRKKDLQKVRLLSGDMITRYSIRKSLVSITCLNKNNWFKE